VRRVVEVHSLTRSEILVEIEPILYLRVGKR
jgi:hypothetical protein